MLVFKLRAMAIAMASVFPSAYLFASAAFAIEPESTAISATPNPQKIDPVEVVIKRLDEARNGLSPDTGSSIYRFGRKDIEALPFGDNTPLNQVLLQTPGMVQDSYGQLHVRGDHANLQYRINGVVIPESIGFWASA